MIRDVNNCREVHFGLGTVGIGKDTTGTVGILYNKPYTPVGDSDCRFNGHRVIEINEKNICLFFHGRNGLKVIDMLISDLQKIKEKIEQDLTASGFENLEEKIDE